MNLIEITSLKFEACVRKNCEKRLLVYLTSSKQKDIECVRAYMMENDIIKKVYCHGRDGCMCEMTLLFPIIKI